MARLSRPIKSERKRQTTLGTALRAAQGKKAPLPVTGKPATEVVRAVSSKTLAERGARPGTIALRLQQERAERNKK